MKSNVFHLKYFNCSKDSPSLLIKHTGIPAGCSVIQPVFTHAFPSSRYITTIHALSELYGRPVTNQRQYKFNMFKPVINFTL